MVLAFLNRFLHWFSVGIMTTVLSLSLLSRGITPAQLGLLMGAYGVAVVVLELPSGIFTDLWGRKSAYLASLLATALGYLLLLGFRGFVPLLGAMAVLALGRAFSSGSIEGLFIAQETAKGDAGSLDGLLRAMGLGETLGLALGALLGGFLPQVWDSLVPKGNRYDANLLAQIAVLGGLFVFTALATHEGPQPGQPGRASPEGGAAASLLHSLGRGLKKPLIRRFLLAALAWGFAIGALETWWQPRLEVLLGSARQSWVFGLLNSGYFLVALLGILASGLVKLRSPRASLAFLALLRLGLGLGLGFLALQRGLWGFVPVYLCLCGFNGLASVPEAGLYNRAIPAQARSSFLSLSSLIVQLGGGASAFLASLVVPAVGITGLWLLAAGVLAASALAYPRAVLDSWDATGVEG